MVPVALFVLACAVAGLAFVMTMNRDSSAEKSEVRTEVATSADATATTAALRVEVPDLLGLGLAEAQALLDIANLELRSSVSELTTGTPDTILSQVPDTGTLLEPGGIVTVQVSRPASSTVSTMPLAVVCIDPGHQSHSDLRPEPIGPGSKITKERVLGGATGITTMVPEYELTLQIANRVRKRLIGAGVRVVMTRTTNDVSRSNAERARISNKAKADLFLRIHANGSGDQTRSGISTIVPLKTGWTRSIHRSSRRAGLIVHRSVLAATGAVDDKVVERGDITGLNWSKYPVILVECGYLSNPVEDRLLSSPAYQDKLAAGIADGVLEYLQVKK